VPDANIADQCVSIAAFGHAQQSQRQCTIFMFHITICAET
jgi:hypothetical protein